MRHGSFAGCLAGCCRGQGIGPWQRVFGLSCWAARSCTLEAPRSWLIGRRPANFSSCSWTPRPSILAPPATAGRVVGAVAVVSHPRARAQWRPRLSTVCSRAAPSRRCPPHPWVNPLPLPSSPLSSRTAPLWLAAAAARAPSRTTRPRISALICFCLRSRQAVATACCASRANARPYLPSRTSGAATCATRRATHDRARRARRNLGVAGVPLRASACRVMSWRPAAVAVRSTGCMAIAPIGLAHTTRHATIAWRHPSAAGALGSISAWRGQMYSHCICTARAATATKRALAA
mmetsp:Transcript_50102/g.130476  ORF Transcript_50102/g.130476 Transcript_50102/m.130476 type:complete len:292 (+) Transcript_50102:519-1394(+)